MTGGGCDQMSEMDPGQKVPPMTPILRRSAMTQRSMLMRVTMNSKLQKIRATAPYAQGRHVTSSPSSAIHRRECSSSTRTLLAMSALYRLSPLTRGCAHRLRRGNLVEVNSAGPIGPRACSFCVEIPISARIRAAPSVKRVGFTSSAGRWLRWNRSMVETESATIASV